MRAAGVVVASMVLVSAAGARVARAQPGMASPPPAGTGPSTKPAPSSEPARDDEIAPIGFALGVDAHLAIGPLIGSDVALRGELAFAPHVALVGRAGIGMFKFLETEEDDPTYTQVFGRVGLRASLEHFYGGIEVGRVSITPHYDMIDGMPAHDGKSFGGTTYTALVGWKLGPVDLGFDYTVPYRAFGFYVGAGYRRR